MAVDVVTIHVPGFKCSRCAQPAERSMINRAVCKACFAEMPPPAPITNIRMHSGRERRIEYARREVLCKTILVIGVIVVVVGGILGIYYGIKKNP